jgi:hypothetical protein
MSNGKPIGNRNEGAGYRCVKIMLRRFMFTLRFLLHVCFPKRCPITDILTAHSSKWTGLIALLSIAIKYIETSGRNVLNELTGARG